MKKSQMKNLALISLLGISQLHALECPPRDNAPLCPTSGTTLLDETYPTQSFLISNQPRIPTKEAMTVTRNFVRKIIENYDYENVPQIILSVQSDLEFDLIKDDTKKVLIDQKVAPEKIEKIMNQFSQVAAPNYTWQQDWFESFINPKTGSPVIRQFESYTRVKPNNGTLLSKAGEKCGITEGEWVKSDYMSDGDDPRKTDESFGSGEMGGNIEGAPGGFCLVGDNQGRDFTKSFCGKKDNIIQLQTSWLSVGHVDELFKIIPTQFNDGRPKECEFSLMAASPKKAMELMKGPNASKTPFMNLNVSGADPKETRDTRSNASLAGNFYLCSYTQEIMKNRPGLIETKPAVKEVFLKLLFGSEAMASFDVNSIIRPEIANDKEVIKFNEECSKNIDQVSNFEIREMMNQDKEFLNLNKVVDAYLEKDRALIKEKILSRLPQCAPYYNELEAPNLFYGDQAVLSKKGKWTLPKPGVANSFLPNPTNSVLMNKTVTFPDSGNTLFNDYMKEELEKRKMKSDFISTWDYAHLGQGNIHCASHSIPYCRPNTKGSK